MAELRFVGGPIDGVQTDLGSRIQERVRLNLPAMLGGTGKAVYDLFIDRDCAFYSFSGWEDAFDAVVLQPPGNRFFGDAA